MKRVLWVRFWALGDVLQSAAEARLFKKRFPNTHLTFLTKPQYADLLRGQPFIDDVISGDKKPWSEFFGTLKKIKQKKIELMISTNHGGKTAIMGLLSGIPQRVGSCPAQFLYHHKLEDWFINVGVNFQDRSEPAIFAPQEAITKAEELLRELPPRRLFAIVGASAVNRMWALEHWGKFLTGILADDWGVVLVGNGKLEEDFAKALSDKLQHKNILNTAGTLSISELSGVASLCSACVGNDTGTLHLAALSGVPTVGLSDYDQYEWLGFRMPWFAGLSAAGKPAHRINSNRGRSAEVLNTITPEKVADELFMLLKKCDPL